MRSPPKFLEGAYVVSSAICKEEVREGRRTNNEARRIRGWKLFHDSSDVVGAATERGA